MAYTGGGYLHYKRLLDEQRKTGEEIWDKIRFLTKTIGELNTFIHAARAQGDLERVTRAEEKKRQTEEEEEIWFARLGEHNRRIKELTAAVDRETWTL